MNVTIYQQGISKGQTQETNSEANLQSAKKNNPKTKTKRQTTKTQKTQTNTTKTPDILLRRTLTMYALAADTDKDIQ